MNYWSVTYYLYILIQIYSNCIPDVSLHRVSCHFEESESIGIAPKRFFHRGFSWEWFFVYYHHFIHFTKVRKVLAGHLPLVWGSIEVQACASLHLSPGAITLHLIIEWCKTHSTKYLSLWTEAGVIILTT